jgi:hypothetical protein
MHRKLALAGLAAVLIAAPVTLATARSDAPANRSQTLAIIGDIPYGQALIDEFPADIAQISADPKVSRVVHLGDIKNGSSTCDNAYFSARLADFGRFEDPLIYTPGDNEWTDCHRANNGGYLPTERLAKIRALFFPHRGETLGRHPAEVDYQSNAFRENVKWSDAGVVFGMVHVVGSNDDQAPWFGDRKVPGTTTPLPETVAETGLRSREYLPREAAAIAWIDDVFDDAAQRHSAGVVVGMQADMWDGDASNQTAFAPIKAVLADRAARFGKPVLLLEGDSHLLKVDTPAGMPSNLVRVVVEGSTNVPHEWLRLRVDPSRPSVFSCENVVFVTGAVTACPAPLAP